jgi:hypothetical protein
MTKDPFGVCAEPECNDEVEPPKNMPSAYNQLKGFLSSAKDIVGGVMAGEGAFVTEDIRNDRLKECHSCEFFDNRSERCSQCGCFMNTKSMFKKTYCPVGKWHEVIDG